MSRKLIPAITRAVEEEGVRESINRLGRINFALRTLTITGTAFALNVLADALLHLSQLPHILFFAVQIAFFSLFGAFLLRPIDQRLMDVGLAGWYKYPVVALWLLSVSLTAAWPSGWQAGLGLFLLLLVLGCSIRGNPLPMELVSACAPTESHPSAYEVRQQNRPRWFISSVGFARSLLTLGCCWLPLIWLENASGGGIRIWFARLGYCILSLVWFYVLVGRLDDAGRWPRKRYQLLLIGLVLLVGVLGRILGEGWSARDHGFLPYSAAHFVYLLRAWLKHLNGYGILALFLFIQIPLVLLSSEPRTERSVSAKDGSNKHEPAVKTNELALSEPFEYLRILFVIACLWVPLIYMDNAFEGSVGSWIARLGYLILGFFWFAFANGRLEDAGWAHSWYPPQYVLVVTVASVMPLAVHWVNGYEALALFVLIQIPTVFLKSKPKPGDSLREAGGAP